MPDPHDHHDHAADDPGHDHDHAHGHGHAHAHAPPQNPGPAFALGIGLNLTFVVAEAIAGSLSGSVSLVADAAHNAGDVLGLFLAWGALVLAKRKPSDRRTYGFRKSTILAALANAILLLVAVGGVAWEAIERLREPQPVAGMTMIVVASIGVLINGLSAMLFLRGQKHDANLRGAFLHLAADALVSVGVVVTGVLVFFTGWSWLDPVVSLIVSIVIVVASWGLLRDAMNLALDAVPAQVDTDAVRGYLRTLEGVHEVHDLHIWAMSTTEVALTAHLVMPRAAWHSGFLPQTLAELRTRFKIQHATLQIDVDEGPTCALACV